jgi:hypothetical protein
MVQHYSNHFSSIIFSIFCVILELINFQSHYQLACLEMQPALLNFIKLTLLAVAVYRIYRRWCLPQVSLSIFYLSKKKCKLYGWLFSKKKFKCHVKLETEFNLHYCSQSDASWLTEAGINIVDCLITFDVFHSVYYSLFTCCCYTTQVLLNCRKPAFIYIVGKKGKDKRNFLLILPYWIPSYVSQLSLADEAESAYWSL